MNIQTKKHVFNEQFLKLDAESKDLLKEHTTIKKESIETSKAASLSSLLVQGLFLLSFALTHLSKRQPYSNCGFVPVYAVFVKFPAFRNPVNQTAPY